MHVYTNLFGIITIPTYGLMIVIGVIAANIAAVILMRKSAYDVDDFIILEAYAMLGGFAGAKILYLVTAHSQIEWNRFFELSYFNSLMQNGFVFYGGLIGGFVLVICAGRWHHIDTFHYISQFIFMIPLIHGFGRIGCFMAGCCYGVPYQGPGAVVFPADSYAIPGVALFPVQLVEACCLFLLAASMIILQLRYDFKYTVSYYFITYGIIRFILEFFRYDEIRGKIGALSTSQWISIFLIILGLCMILFRRRKER